MPRPGAPALPAGLVAIVKRDCPTCELVAPVLGELAARAELTDWALPTTRPSRSPGTTRSR
jgi:hypothetical protein